MLCMLCITDVIQCYVCIDLKHPDSTKSRQRSVSSMTLFLPLSKVTLISMHVTSAIHQVPFSALQMLGCSQTYGIIIPNTFIDYMAHRTACREGNYVSQIALCRAPKVSIGARQAPFQLIGCLSAFELVRLIKCPHPLSRLGKSPAKTSGEE